MQTINIIIQARMNSSRLPGKVLRPLMEKPMLSYQIERVKRCKTAHNLIIATSINQSDDIIETFCKQNKILCYRGSENDVLDRYYQACQKYPTDVVVRLTADCPLIDSGIIDETIALFLDSPVAYASNTLERTYPRGMDVEVFSEESLTKAWEKATLLLDREHVTRYIYKNFKELGNLSMSPDTSSYRLTVDTIEDFKLIETIYTSLYPKNKEFDLGDILDAFEDHPEWLSINKNVKQKEC